MSTDKPRARHQRIERERLGFDPLELAAAATRRIHALEEAERAYVEYGIADMEAHLAFDAALGEGRR